MRRMRTKERDSNLEALRILSMFLIVLDHSLVFSLGFGKFATNLCVWGAGVGVNCFVLISGYYMITSRITLEKILRLWAQVAAYSVVLCGIYLINRAADGEACGALEAAGHLAKAFFSIFGYSYWFVSVYVILMLGSPFLNQYLCRISKAERLRFCAALFLLLVINSFTGSYCGKIGWFVLLYSIAAAFRLHPDLIRTNRQIFRIMASGSFAVILACVFLRQASADYIPGALGLNINRVLDTIGVREYSWAEFVLSVSLFALFASCGMGQVRWINRIAACSLGVYLLHVNRYFLFWPWKNVFHIDSMEGSPWILPYCLCSSIVVYLVCTSVEMLRMQTLGRLYDYAARKWILPRAEAVWGKVRHAFERPIKIICSDASDGKETN